MGPRGSGLLAAQIAIALVLAVMLARVESGTRKFQEAQLGIRPVASTQALEVLTAAQPVHETGESTPRPAANAENDEPEDPLDSEEWDDVASLSLDRQRVYADLLFQSLLAGTREGDDVGYHLEECDPGVVLDAVRRWWPKITDPVDARELLEALLYNESVPQAAELFDLAMEHPDANMRAFALDELFSRFLVDLPDDVETYRAWRERTRGLPAAELARQGIEDIVARLRVLDPASPEAVALRDRLGNASVEDQGTLKEAGYARLLEDWLAAGGDAASRALGLTRLLDDDEDWARRHILPALSEPSLRGHVLYALANNGCRWALPEIERCLRDPDSSTVHAAASAVASLASRKEAAALLIAALEAAPSAEAARAIELGGLARFTPLPYHGVHDAVWWREWWRQNADTMDGGEKLK